MQKELDGLKKGRVQLAAVSYDSVDVLKKFGKAEKIRFPLLSDPDSKTIEAFGIRNERANGRTDGIPHPGTFLIGEDGVIRAKLFYKSIKKRHLVKDILEATKKLPMPAKKAA